MTEQLGGHLAASQGQPTTALNFLSAGASLFLSRPEVEGISKAVLHCWESLTRQQGFLTAEQNVHRQWW